jgi:hypothetical protein
MKLIQIVSVFITNPLFYPIWWLIGSWLIWLLLRLTPRRPSLPNMLIYSVSVLIAFVKSLRIFEACFLIEICAPDFGLPWFLVEVSFWFVVLYLLMNWISSLERARSQEVIL